MSHALRGGLTRLDLTTKVTLAVLALASGVYTYLGVRDLLNGSASIVFFGAVMYSTAVSVGIYAFWSYLMRFMPHVTHMRSRAMLYLAMVIGSAMIIAMSSWLNAAALAGGAALEQHLANTTEEYQDKLEQAHENALAAQSLLPDIQLAAQRFSSLAQEEQYSGSLTGTSGSGTVVQLLNQMSGQLTELGSEVASSREQVKSLFEQGGAHLARMRQLVSSSGEIIERSNLYAEEAVALAGVIGALQQTSIAPSVKRAADDLGRSFIAPIADGTTEDLASRQTEVVGRVEIAIRTQSAALSAAADEILQRPQVEAVRFTPLSTAEAVLLYARDFLPSWAGAISIDLLPAVLVFVLCVVHDAIRRQDNYDADAELMTAAEMRRAMRLYRSLGTDRHEDEAGAPALAEAARQTEPQRQAPPAADVRRQDERDGVRLEPDLAKLTKAANQ
jgi:hypothetical protein